MKPTEKLLHIVAEYFGISDEALKSKDQTEPMPYARHIFRYLAYKNHLGTQISISESINGNHSMVSTSRKKIEEWLTYDKALLYDLNAIENLFIYFDQFRFVKWVAQQTPAEKMPELVGILEEWEKGVLNDR